jgi:amino acid adenylation domain-containing protein
VSTEPQAPPRRDELSAAKRALLERRLRGRAGGRDRIGRRPDGVEAPLSFAQERLWFMEQYAPGTAAYGIPVVLRLRGRLDPALLLRALRGLAGRHETLRTRFPVTGDGRPALLVEDAAGLSLPLVEVEPGPDGDAERRADEIVRLEAARPFDVGTGPVLRPLLVRLAPDDHLVLLAVHHIAADGWSTEILVAELLALYGAARSGTPPPLAELPIQYADYAHWQRRRLTGAVLERHLAYWRQQLEGVPPLELPVDRPRPATMAFEGAWHEFRIDQGLTAGLEELGRGHGATLYMTLLAGWQVLLARWSGQRDFAVGSPVAGRDRSELEGLIGMFVNMLPLRAGVEDRDRFADLLARTRSSVLDALAHQELPFEQLVSELGMERDVSRSPLFQVTFVMQNYQSRDGDGLDGLRVSWSLPDLPATRYDLELHVLQWEGGLRCKLCYSTALFDRSTVERMATHLETLLRGVVAQPDRPLPELGLMGPAERSLVTERWNATTAPFPSHATLPELVEAQVGRTPDATAVSFEGERLCYAELDQRANRVARRLRAMGAGPETLVGVCAERSCELVVGLLGVLKAGAAYVPLDPEHPAERLAFMLEDAAAPMLLTQRRLVGRLPPTSARVLLLDDPAAWAGEPAERPPAGPRTRPDNVAYVIYTSGSTGRPKGVANTHRGIVNRLDWMQRAYRLGAGDVVAQKTPVSFDVSVWELFWPLLTGARLVLARPGGHRDPAHLRDLIVREQVTTAHFVPSMLAAFLAEEGVERCGSLRRVICSGEELPLEAARRFLRRLPGCELHNLYGPTEAAVDVSAWPCRPEALAGLTRVPIGGPIQNLRLYVLGPELEPVPVGVAGELHLGGVGLARGYHGRPGLTAQRFVPDPFGPPSSRLYRTGDLARWRPDGTVEFLGRIDDQVKLRGLRIEPGEVEAVLRERPEVRDTAVMVREDAPGDRRLVAYLTATPGGDPLDPGRLRAFLAARLPDYMVPAAFVPLDALPVTPNGKLDRKALPAPERERPAGRELVEARTPMERTVASVWREVLGVERVGVDDDFFDLGGHSLLATQMVARLRRAVDGAGRPVSVMDAFKHRTIRGLAALIERPEEGPRRLLHELTPPVGGSGRRVRSYVCVPYGGGSAVVYQPLADALPAGHSLWSIAIPGHDVGLDEDALPFDELAERCVQEILGRVQGPLVLYGHCGVGGAVVVELARRLEAAGRELEAVYVAAMFPFARPKGLLAALAARLERLSSNRAYANWLKSMGVDMDELDPDHADRILRNMRHDTEAAEQHFTDLLDRRVARLRAPIISVVGERDSITDYYQERYKEWHFLAETSAVAVLEEAGHFFLKYRAAEVAEIVTGTHTALARGDAESLSRAARGPDAPWALHGVDRGPRLGAGGEGDRQVQPSMRRFLTVAAGQLVSMTGSALTQWAIPVWMYLETGSLARYGLLAVLALLPGLLGAPLAGAIIDRSDRRRVMIAASLAAGGAELALALLLLSDRLTFTHVYGLVVWLSVASVFQRVAYAAAIPQLVPKWYLGHANGVMQLTTGVATLLMPLAAAGVLAAIGLGGILGIDVASYAFALVILALVRFPRTMAWRRREPLASEIAGGFRYLWEHRGFRASVVFFILVSLFLGAPLVLVSPLVLSFGTLADVGRVAVVEGLGAVVGGLAMSLWGGPRRYRMLGVIAAIAMAGAFIVLTGGSPTLPVIAVGVFGTALGLALDHGIYLTIVQVKVPQRFHGRVIALNQMVSWSTLPLGYAVIAPLGTRLLEPLLAPGGALASTVGAVIGTGPGRGIGLMFMLSGLAILATVGGALRSRVLSRFDLEVPDAPPDDLVGAQALQRRPRPAARAA